MQKIVGIKKNDYFSQKRNVQVKGLNVYYEQESVDVQGRFAGDLWIVAGNRLYERLENLKIPPNGIECELVYDNTGRFPQLLDIVLKQA